MRKPVAVMPTPIRKPEPAFEPKNERQAYDFMLDIAHERSVYDADPLGGAPHRY